LSIHIETKGVKANHKILAKYVVVTKIFLSLTEGTATLNFGKFLRKLRFHNNELMNRLCQLLVETVFEIENESTQNSLYALVF
jgi:hypothetical protein